MQYSSFRSLGPASGCQRGAACNQLLFCSRTKTHPQSYSQRQNTERHTVSSFQSRLCTAPRHGLRVAAKASVAESSQDMDDLELEEELEEAYNDEIPIEMKLPGGKASAYAGRRGRQSDTSDGGRKKAEDALQERILQISRVTKVVKGGKQISFRAVVAVGDGQGTVGVGTSSAKEIAMGVRKAIIDASNNLITIPLTRGLSFPHKQDGIAGGAKVMLRPASEGTGVIAGGAVREVLELSGVKNGFGKQLGSNNPLNNARATIDGLSKMRTLKQAAKNRDLTVEQMLGAQ